MRKCRNCGNPFPNRIIIEGKERNITKRVYCLECSPFKMNNRKILEHKSDGQKYCPRCKKILNTNHFYISSKHSSGFSPYCKECTKDESLERTVRFKQKCVDYKGGKCSKCGYNKCIAALEFHHINPSQKDISISSIRFTTFNDTVKGELDKCVILCANCHREIHNL